MHHLSRSLFVAIACLAGLAIAVPPSYARETLYKTGFEPPTFFPGGLVGQDGWITPPPFSPNAAVISTAQPRQGKQSVLVRGSDLEHQDFINTATKGYYDAIGSYRRPVGNNDTGYDTGGTQVVRVSAHVRVDGPRPAHDDNFFSASIGAIALGEENGEDSPEGVGELAISSDGRVHAYSGADLVPHFLTSARVTLREWHNLAVEANFATRQMSFFVDDECLGSFPFDARVTTNFLLRGSLLTYAAPDGVSHKADYQSRFDHFKIQVVKPEECEAERADR